MTTQLSGKVIPRCPNKLFSEWGATKLKPCDDVLMIRNMGGEQAHRMSDQNNHRVDAAMNKSKIGLSVQIARLNLQATPS